MQRKDLYGKNTHRTTIQPVTEANLITRSWKTADRNRCSYSSYSSFTDCRRVVRFPEQGIEKSVPSAPSPHHDPLRTIRPSRTEANKLCYYIRNLPDKRQRNRRRQTGRNAFSRSAMIVAAIYSLLTAIMIGER